MSKHALTGWFRPSGLRFQRYKPLILFGCSMARLEPRPSAGSTKTVKVTALIPSAD
ncbi:MAG: hypothetical protein WAN26_10755 [Steroidobacteraceae bacterium]